MRELGDGQALPSELYLRILDFLPFKDLFRLGRVSRDWRESLCPRAVYRRTKESGADLLIRHEASSSHPAASGWNFLRLFLVGFSEHEEEIDEEEVDELGAISPRRMRRVCVFEFRSWEAATLSSCADSETDPANARPTRTSPPSWLVPHSMFIPPTPPPIEQPPELRRQGIILLPAGPSWLSAPLRITFGGWDSMDIGSRVAFGAKPPPPGMIPFVLAKERLFLLPPPSSSGRIRTFGDIDCCIELEDLEPIMTEERQELRTLKIVSVRCTTSFLALGFSGARSGPSPRPSRSTEAIFNRRIPLPRSILPPRDARIAALTAAVVRRGMPAFSIFKFEFSRRYLIGHTGDRPGGWGGEAAAANEMASLMLSAERSEAQRRGDVRYLELLDRKAAEEEAAQATWAGFWIRWMRSFFGQ
ncbi:hypothetical protein DFJ74DRAFT_710102 [Hyaloraphidium curvatum]|nr:hypothetical protein DFJ74DRAFT_710102 [Hyaloraphidium curvatum]